MTKDIRRHKDDGMARVPTYEVPADLGARFSAVVQHGNRGKALRNLFMIAMSAMAKHRRIWSTIIEHPENLELRRKP